MTPQRFKGKIKSWNAERAFGFIETTDKKQVFFHIDALQSPQIKPIVGETVQLLAVQNEKGWKATAVSSPERKAKAQPKHIDQFTQGKIIKWDDDRGFGFIQIPNMKEQIFFHVNDLSLNQGKFRPQEGEAVLVKAKYDGKRWTATVVTSGKRQLAERKINQREESLHSRASIAMVCSLLWLGIVAFRLPKLAAIYAGLSLVLYLMYQKDKNAANAGEWRVPEDNLHMFALVGGWCGGLIARYQFNHKTTKQEFVTTFWITVIANIGATIYFMPELTAWLK
ncbi:DUF1294 domain-containing protein [Kingella kingae]|uniref:DUF1294 domain-containing protein n=1 Tax=Kingella kingae TaxID=504 RepID=UPI00254A3607|nr:DUF1294 domain-containing protein [Kingella kingae]MDK4530878.1 DUF1294 domain-containing protein [Kingella kingae]MDK4580981.1 DUF1294 domain-containing protein [Kingella kingae]